MLDDLAAVKMFPHIWFIKFHNASMQVVSGVTELEADLLHSYTALPD